LVSTSVSVTDVHGEIVEHMSKNKLLGHNVAIHIGQ